MVLKPRRKFKSSKPKRKRGNAKVTIPKTQKSTKRLYKYENHAIQRASKEIAPCDKTRYEKITLKDYTDSKGVFHKADIPPMKLSNLNSMGKLRKQNNWRGVEWDYVNRKLGIVIEIDGIGHYSSHAFGSWSFITGRENDLIKEAFCKQKRWIMVRVSNLCAKNPIKCCGIPEFNRRLEKKFAKIKRMLGSRMHSSSSLRTSLPVATSFYRTTTSRPRLSTPLAPIARQEQITQRVAKVFMNLF